MIEKNYSLNINGKLFSLAEPKVMGILNATPDSFYESSRAFDSHKIEIRLSKLLKEGADIIDIGAYSSRPGCEDITTEQEIDRLDRALEVVRRVAPDAILSVDTFRSQVARHVVEKWNVNIINDIAGGILDKEMFETVAELRVPYVLMHMRGTPQTMTKYTDYADVTADVISDLSFKLAELHALGVADVIVDPGFGFAKTLEQNFQLLRELEAFESLNAPVLIGVSRKSMVTRTLGVGADEALNGTTVLNTIALMKGAKILRVHDVKEARQTIALFEALNK